MSEAKETRSGDRTLVLSCLAAQIGMGFGAYVFPIFLKPVTEDLGWSRTAYSIAQPILATSVALVGPVVGRISDTTPRRVLVLGGILLSVSLLLASGMQHVWQFYGIAVVGGVAVACLGDLPTAAAITSRFRDHRGRALSTVYIGSNIGGALGPALAVAVASYAGWRAGYFTIGALAWLLILPAFFFLRRTAVPPSPASERPLPDPEAPAASASGNTVAQAIRTRDFWLLFWAIFVFYLYRLGVNTQLVAYLSDAGYSEGLATASYSLMVGIGLAGKLFAGQLADRIGARPAVIGNFVLMTFASFLILAPDWSWAIPTFLIVHGATTAAEDVVVPLLVGRRFGSRHLAGIYGIVLLALIPGAVIGPAAAGWTYDLLGNYQRIFLAFGLLNLSSVAALLLISTRRGSRV
ncbi:MAG: MFS transporter [bacterium]